MFTSEIIFNPHKLENVLPIHGTPEWNSDALDTGAYVILQLTENLSSYFENVMYPGQCYFSMTDGNYYEVTKR